MKIKKICVTHEEQVKGMMNDTLKKDECCIFMYPSKRLLSFWMKNTPQDLDIYYIDGLDVIQVDTMWSYTLTPHKSLQPVTMAIEAVHGVLNPIDKTISFEDGYVVFN